MALSNADRDLVDVLYKTAGYSADDLKPLLAYLKYDGAPSDLTTRSAAEAIAGHLRRMGSNDIATLFRGEGVGYATVVYEVGRKLKAKGVSKSATVPENEARIIEKIFSDTLDHLTEEERRLLFRSLNLDVKDLPLSSSAAVLIPILLKQFGGFATYRFALIASNFVARSLLGSGLTLATNAALTRVIAGLLGPVGWITSGAWLAIDLAGPAFRKTVPAVLYVAMLRLTLQNRLCVGVVGDGSAGKDTLIEKVFRIAARASPVAGSTAEVVRYDLSAGGDAFVINYPGFNDYRPSVNAATDEALHHTDVFLLVVDISRGISGTDVSILEKVRKLGKRTLVCLNKWDLPRSQKHRDELLETARDRLGLKEISGPAFDVAAEEADAVLCVLDPDPRLGEQATGGDEIAAWVKALLRDAGKNEALLKGF